MMLHVLHVKREHFVVYFIIDVFGGVIQKQNKRAIWNWNELSFKKMFFVRMKRFFPRLYEVSNFTHIEP